MRLTQKLAALIERVYDRPEVDARLEQKEKELEDIEEEKLRLEARREYMELRFRAARGRLQERSEPEE